MFLGRHPPPWRESLGGWPVGLRARESKRGRAAVTLKPTQAPRHCVCPEVKLLDFVGPACHSLSQRVRSSLGFMSIRCVESSPCPKRPPSNKSHPLRSEPMNPPLTAVFQREHGRKEMLIKLDIGTKVLSRKSPKQNPTQIHAVPNQRKPLTASSLVQAGTRGAPSAPAAGTLPLGSL